eukprot:1148103-Pelagomonas_calceolata.AAC.7
MVGEGGKRTAFRDVAANVHQGRLLHSARDVFALIRGRPQHRTASPGIGGYTHMHAHAHIRGVTGPLPLLCVLLCRPDQPAPDGAPEAADRTAEHPERCVRGAS